MSGDESSFPHNHNNPPEPTPFDLSSEEIEGLYMESKNWLDGSGVNTEADETAVSKLISDLRKAIKTADERRMAENAPFDAGKDEVQARYAPLIADTKKVKGQAVLALDVAKKALEPFLQRKDEANRIKAAAVRKEADEKAAAAQAQMRAAASTDLEARAEAEKALRDAKAAETTATRAEGAKAHATGGTRAIGLRTTYKHEITDVRAFAAYAWKAHYDELCDFLNDLARMNVANGRRDMPGVLVREEKVL